MHVDEFIDDFGTDPYVSWFLMMKRLPAVLQFKFEEFTKDLKLFCTYGGECWRVTGASRLGDIWITKDFTQDIGYQKRVNIDDCTEFTKEPHRQAK